MRIISLNVNGLRAFYNKGALSDLLVEFNPDILCLQETKCDEETVQNIVTAYNDEFGTNYKVYANSSKGKSGYAGVATLLKADRFSNYVIIAQSMDLIDDSDDENFKYYVTGRIQRIIIGKFQLINVYVLNSGGKESYRPIFNDRLSGIIECCYGFSPYLVLTGDFNVVATELDYWGNYEGVIDSGPGLYQFEIDDFHNKLKLHSFTDAFRYVHPSTRAYSWFNYRGPARRLNHGWRLDYFLVSEKLKGAIHDSRIYPKFEGSDHRPIELILSNN